MFSFTTHYFSELNFNSVTNILDSSHDMCLQHSEKHKLTLRKNVLMDNIQDFSN